MSNFNIGDEVRVTGTKESGVIIDRLFSESKQSFLYAIKPHDGGKQFTRFEKALEPYYIPPKYTIETTVEDNVVILVIYELSNGIKTEVARGHGHCIHEELFGVVQAISYATKGIMKRIDESGVYFKQNKK
jgi:hypothetical protein